MSFNSVLPFLLQPFFPAGDHQVFFFNRPRPSPRKREHVPHIRRGTRHCRGSSSAFYHSAVLGSSQGILFNPEGDLFEWLKPPQLQPPQFSAPEPEVEPVRCEKLLQSMRQHNVDQIRMVVGVNPSAGADRPGTFKIGNQLQKIFSRQVHFMPWPALKAWVDSHSWKIPVFPERGRLEKSGAGSSAQNFPGSGGQVASPKIPEFVFPAVFKSGGNVDQPGEIEADLSQPSWQVPDSGGMGKRPEEMAAWTLAWPGNSEPEKPACRSSLPDLFKVPSPLSFQGFLKLLWPLLNHFLAPERPKETRGPRTFISGYRMPVRNPFILCR